MRLIDVDKLKFPNIAIFDMKLHGVTVPMVRLIDLQMLMPTVDAAPVIRCKDCINWDTNWTTHPPEHYCPAIDQFTSANFYCGYAEKKDLEERDAKEET